MSNTDLELAESRSQDELRLRRKVHDHGPSIASRPFAGRIGGNQEFILNPSDASFVSTVQNLPDAGAAFTWKQSFSLRGFTDVELWKESFLEGIGTCLQIYLSGLAAIGLGDSAMNTSLGPVTPAAFGAITNVFLITLFVYAGGPVSGGHFNPLITMSTFFARLAIFPRAILYVLFQCTGSVIAGFLIRASLGRPPASFRAVPGCYIDPLLVSPGQAYVSHKNIISITLTVLSYVLETMTSFALLFIAFGVGLDPRQRQVFGPALSPFLVCFAYLLQMHY